MLIQMLLMLVLAIGGHGHGHQVGTGCHYVLTAVREDDGTIHVEKVFICE